MKLWLKNNVYIEGAVQIRNNTYVMTQVKNGAKRCLLMPAVTCMVAAVRPLCGELCSGSALTTPSWSCKVQFLQLSLCIKLCALNSLTQPEVKLGNSLLGGLEIKVVLLGN